MAGTIASMNADHGCYGDRHQLPVAWTAPGKVDSLSVIRNMLWTVQEILESATGKEQVLTSWQKQRLLKARVIGDNADKDIAVGRGTAALGDLPFGVDPRLILAARVICSPSEAASRRADTNCPPQQEAAAAFVLVYQYLQMVFSGLGLDAIREQV